MTPCFGDTSYYLALLIPEDVNHHAARQLARVLRRPIVTSEFILLEVSNHLSAGRSRLSLGPFLHSIRDDPQTNVVPLSSELMNRAIVLYLARQDKTWSLTDCTSFIIMADRGIADALTADRHFEQAGLSALLRDEN